MTMKEQLIQLTNSSLKTNEILDEVRQEFTQLKITISTLNSKFNRLIEALGERNLKDDLSPPLEDRR